MSGNVTVATKLKVLMSTKAAYNSFSNQFGNTSSDEYSITRAIWNSCVFVIVYFSFKTSLIFLRSVGEFCNVFCC